MARIIAPERILRDVESLILSGGLNDWLVERAQQDTLRYLLAHTDEGVIWGYVDDQGLHLSCDQGPLARNELTLDPQRLQQLRLFGANAELYLWRGPQAQPSAMAELQARIFRDQRAPQRDPSSTAPDNEYAYMDEAYLLWGWGDEVKDGFVTLVEGTQGIVHSPPLAAPVNEGRRAALTVRHYLQPDAEGLVQVVGSRLVGLK